MLDKILIAICRICAFFVKNTNVMFVGSKIGINPFWNLFKNGAGAIKKTNNIGQIKALIRTQRISNG